MAHGGNGNNKLLWWLLSALLAVVLAGGGMWVKSLDGKVRDLGQRDQEQGEQLSALKTIIPVISEQLKEINGKLEVIQAVHVKLQVDNARRKR